MTTSINVYLKLKPNNKVTFLIRDFNQFLSQNQLFSIFQINPFLDKHPLHITLYLTNYENNQIPELLNRIKKISLKEKPTALSTEQFIAKNSGYVMLTVNPSKKLTQLSNNIVQTLMGLRDKKATIPAWAAQDKKRTTLFKLYGSPNVSSYFNPHFSVFDPERLSKKQKTELYKRLSQLIQQFSQAHQTHVSVTAYAIGIGVADTQGQIVRELESFNLK